MKSLSIQAPGAVVMIRPHRFLPNPETAADNAFQRESAELPGDAVSKKARDEFNAAVARLEQEAVRAHVFDDFGERETPDSVFPNNWFSTHGGGYIAIYPMYSPNRRRERRADVIEMLKAQYRVQEIVDYSGLEWDGLFLEGTGAMVFDHIGRIAYTALSNRANVIVLERFCAGFDYEPMAFETMGNDGRPVYHTNVIMCVGTHFALICLDMITDPARRKEISNRLQETGREVIELDREQIAEYAGNAIELFGNDGSLLALSTRAAAVLRPEQVEVIERSARLVPLSIPTIELAGGSVRCMIAGIHLTPR
jgi:hypothetical protein